MPRSGDETDGRDDEIQLRNASQSSPVNFKLCEKSKISGGATTWGLGTARGLRGSTLEDMINHTNDLLP